MMEYGPNISAAESEFTIRDKDAPPLPHPPPPYPEGDVYEAYCKENAYRYDTPTEEQILSIDDWWDFEYLVRKHYKMFLGEQKEHESNELRYGDILSVYHTSQRNHPQEACHEPDHDSMGE